ncbi:uncharacterized protein TRUGW13939_08680 [Talaromyces rugulosus]|uniref:Stc1 domain-containing protein n=1 Tax=Talaromyces rugulosus TaxID=121627 RepID=A0A7H8R6F1_TALRU|nr:uncharacterized protein TRUGW13939_08680 [Talaromyces rugulosus]QKX61528.1 hypothetical protein TRUGW13939_08680 [Talaromyces rugulosus]
MAGGWSEEKVNRVKNLQLPQMLKCMGCHKTRSHTAYSGGQLQRLRQSVVSRGQGALVNPQVRCRICTGGEAPVEITCIRCDKRKFVEDFFKAQRQNLDTATCINCVSDGQMARPWDGNEGTGDSDNEYLHGDDDCSTVVGSTLGGVSLRIGDVGDEANETSSMNSRPSIPSLTGSRRGNGDDYDDGDTDSSDGDGFLEDPSQPDTSSIVNSSWTNSSAMSSSAINEDSQASALSRLRDTRGDYDWKMQEPRSSRYRPPTSSKPSKWAKTRAHDPTRDARNMRIPEPSEVAEEDDRRSEVGTSVPPESYL